MANLRQLLSLFLLHISPITALTYTNQFRDWYPQYAHIFEAIKNDFCADEYAAYLTGVKNHSHIDIIGGGGIYTVVTQPVINCILNHTSDYVKNGMTSAQVLLGTMPTVLALMGASSEEMSMLSNVARRPVLAFLLAAGSPSVYFSRAFEYNDPGQILQTHPNRLPQWRPSSFWAQLLISVLEYSVALAAFANVATINWQLGVGTICSFWTDGIIAPTVWACLGVVAHMLGGFVTRMRLRGWRGPSEEVQDAVEQAEATLCAKHGLSRLKRTLSYAGSALKAGGTRGFSGNKKRKPAKTGLGFASVLRDLGNWFRETPRRIRGIFSTELVPAAAAQYDVAIVTFMESKTFLVCAWALSTVTIFHIIFGTLVFASTTFIGTRDALPILARYICSVALCRVVLMYELAGMREACVSIHGLVVPRDELREEEPEKSIKGSTNDDLPLKGTGGERQGVVNAREIE